MTSTQLDRVDPIQALTEKPWINQITADQLALLQKTVAKGLSNAETGQFLELARSLGMNPWANEIWAAKGKGKDGGEGKLLLMVGRDGLIGHAERNFDDYMGYDAGVVCKADTYERVEPDPDAKTMRGRAGVVHHEGHPDKRGDIIGAWAVAERRGRPPRYFYAKVSEYMPTYSGVKYSPWGTSLAAMIEKVPISFVHRTLCGLGSVYLEEEVARARFDVESTAVEEKPGALSEAIFKHVPAGQVVEAAELIEEMNRLAPNSWSASKVEMVFSGKSGYNASVELSQIGKAIEELRERAEKAGVQTLREQGHDVEANAAEAGAHITDAVVVEPGSDSSGSDEADAPSPEALEKVAILKSREETLTERYSTADGREEEELGIELEQIREEIRDLGGTPASDTGGVDQGSLPL